MNQLNLERLEVNLLDYAQINIDEPKYLSHWEQVTDITEKLKQGRLEIPDQYQKLTKKGIAINSFAKVIRNIAEQYRFRVLDAHMSGFYQEKEFLPVKVILCTSSTIDDTVHNAIDASAELAGQMIPQPHILMDIPDDYIEVYVNPKKERYGIFKLLTKPNEQWLLDLQEKLQKLFGVEFVLDTRVDYEMSNNSAEKARKNILEALQYPMPEQDKNMLLAGLAKNTSINASYMKDVLEKTKNSPTIFITSLPTFLFARSALKDNSHFSSYVAFVPK